MSDDPYAFSIQTLKNGVTESNLFSVDEIVTVRVVKFNTINTMQQVTVFWGDGSYSVESSMELTHEYSDIGSYEIECYVKDTSNNIYTTDIKIVSIGNVDSDIIYVDLNKVATSANYNSGSISDPLAGEEFLTAISTGKIYNTSGYNDISTRPIFKLRGNANLTISPDFVAAPAVQVMGGYRSLLDVWDASVYGPWVMKFSDPRVEGGRVVADFSGAILRGGIIYNTTDSGGQYGAIFNFTKLYNMYVVCQGTNSKISLVTDNRNVTNDESYIIGSTIYSTNGVVVSE